MNTFFAVKQSPKFNLENKQERLKLGTVTSSCFMTGRTERGRARESSLAKRFLWNRADAASIL